MTTSALPVSTLDTVPLILRTVSNQKISTVLCLDGHIETQLLGTAMRYLLKHNPVLASVLVVNRNQAQWRYSTERLRQAAPAVISSAHPDEQATDYIESLAAGAGNTLDVRVCRGPVHDTLCITIDHTAADAAGCREAVRQLARIYGCLQRSEYVIADSAATRRRDLGGVWPRLGVLSCLVSAMSPGIALPRWRFPTGADKDSGKPVYVLRHFEAGRLGGLQAIARRRNATINDLLLAALFRALLIALPGGDSRRRPVQFTADLRRYLPAGERRQIANLSGSGAVWLQPGKATRFETMAAHVHAQMNRAKRHYPGAGSSLWLNLLFAAGLGKARQLLDRGFNASRQSGMANPLLTNFGVIDRAAFRFGTTEVRHAYLTAPSLMAPGLVVGASSFGNTLTLSTGFDAGITNPALIGKVLDQIVSDLESDR